MDIEADIDWDLSETIDIQPVEFLSDDQASDFNAFTKDIKDMFATLKVHLTLNELGCCNLKPRNPFNQS